MTLRELYKSPEIQVNEVALAIRGLLKALGENPDREGLKDTPSRVARMYQELLAGVQEEAAQPLLEEGVPKTEAHPVHQEGSEGIGEPSDDEDRPGVDPSAGCEESPDKNEGVRRNGREEVLDRRTGALVACRA